MLLLFIIHFTVFDYKHWLHHLLLGVLLFVVIHQRRHF